MWGETPVGARVTLESVGVQILGEGVGEHVMRRAVEKTCVSVLNAVAESVYPVVDVLGPVIGNGVFAHHPTTAVIFVDWSRSLLRVTHAG